MISFTGPHFCTICVLWYWHEDVEFTPRALFYATKIVKYDDSFYNYNIHLGPDSFSGMEINAHKLYSHYEMRKRTYLFFQNNPVDKVSDYTKVVSAGSILHVYYTARAQKIDNFKSFIKPLLKEYKALYGTLRHNPYCSPKIKFLIFRLCPASYYFIKRTYEKMKPLIKRWQR